MHVRGMCMQRDNHYLDTIIVAIGMTGFCVRPEVVWGVRGWGIVLARQIILLGAG